MTESNEAFVPREAGLFIPVAIPGIAVVVAASIFGVLLLSLNVQNGRATVASAIIPVLALLYFDLAILAAGLHFRRTIYRLSPLAMSARERQGMATATEFGKDRQARGKSGLRKFNAA